MFNVRFMERAFTSDGLMRSGDMNRLGRAELRNVEGSPVPSRIGPRTSCPLPTPAPKPTRGPAPPPKGGRRPARLDRHPCWVQPGSWEVLCSWERRCVQARSTRSRRADAVEAGGIICPLGIGEIGRAAGEGQTLDPRPSGFVQVRAGFHHYGTVRCPGNDESEPVGLDAKVGAVAEDQGLRKHPECCGASSKGYPATRSARQVIDGRRAAVEHVQTKARGVALKIHSSQAGAPGEHIVPDAGDAVGDRDAAQAVAVNERIVTDAGDRQTVDRVWDDHRTAGAGVPCDGERAVIGRASVVLRLHHDGGDVEDGQPEGGDDQAKRCIHSFPFPRLY